MSVLWRRERERISARKNFYKNLRSEKWRKRREAYNKENERETQKREKIYDCIKGILNKEQACTWAGAPGASVHHDVLRCLQSLPCTWPDSLLLGFLVLKSFYLSLDFCRFVFLIVDVITSGSALA